MEILDDIEGLFVIMTMNSVLPGFADHELGARGPPLGQKVPVADLPMMAPIRDPQRQTSLLAPLSHFRFLLQIRVQTARMALLETFAAPVRYDAAPAGAHSIGNRFPSSHRQLLLCEDL
jgi:hypothetical protein